MVDKVTVIRYSFAGEKFEILVKPDPALEYRLGKRKDISSILVSDEIYSDSNKGTRASTEKLQKAFKTTDPTAIIERIVQKGDLNLTTDQRRKMTSEKQKQVCTRFWCWNGRRSSSRIKPSKRYFRVCLVVC